MTIELHNNTLEWAAEWIEGSLKGEDSQRVREFGRNMAMTLKAAKVPDLTPVSQPPTEIDLEWALRELADGWITNNEREGPHGFYQNARRVLNAIANDGADRQREADAQLVESYHECPSTNDYNIATAIRNAK